MYETIEIEKLVAHPATCIRMSRIMAKKLATGIQTLGWSGAVIVRPRVESGGWYEILDGYERVEAMRTLGWKKVNCEVWDADDDLARLFIAISNSVRGVSVPELRITLIFELLETFSPSQLTSMLPESEPQLRALLALNSGEYDEDSGHEPRHTVESDTEADILTIPASNAEDVTLTMHLTKSEYCEIKNVLQNFMKKAGIKEVESAIIQYLLKNTG